MKISSLNIYPIKSCRGVDLNKADVLSRGLEYDRRWMIVDAQGVFISQRSHSKLAQMIVAADNEGLDITLGDKSFRVRNPRGARIDVRVWKSVVNAPLADIAINAALSEWLGQEVSLVYMDEDARRATNPDWSPIEKFGAHETSFSDGYPVLVTNMASLDALNDHIRAAGYDGVTMERFRPNIVIDTDMPWAEDGWESLQIGDVVIDLVKPCTRCLVTTLDPYTGNARPEPVMDAMRELRMSQDPRNKGVLFGVNALVRRGGVIKRGLSVNAT